ncbi:MAG: MFS transporter, partial [Promethearchaeota archaeon]
WDAVNDPITGNLLDRSSKFTERYGKRFPFIAIGVFGALLCIILLYLPITGDLIMIVLWLLFVVIIYDAFQTIFDLSIAGFIVDRFRDQKQRVKLGTFTHIFAGISTLTAAVFVPILLGVFGGVSDPRAYFLTALILIISLFIIAIVQLTSVHEPVEMKELRARLNDEGKSSSPPKELIKRAFNDRNWMGVTLAYVTWVVEIGCVSVGLSFYVVDVLGLSIAAAAVPILIFLLVGFAVVPFWMKITRILGAKKAYFYALLSTAITTGSFILAWNYTVLIMIAALGGIGHGGQGVVFNTILSESIDDATVKSGIREESSYFGILRFFSATGIFWQVLIFAVVQTITGYDPLLGTRNSDLAKLGLNLQMSLVPATCMLISVLIFWKLYTISKDQAIENKKKLIEMKL